MQFPRLSAPSLKELFVQELEGMILSGKLSVGTKLPPERELAKAMQVSRAVVNAGLSEMEQKGFVEIRPRIGATVSDFRRNGTADTLLSIMRYNGGRLRRDEVRSILQIKLVLDRLAAELAATNAPDGDIEILSARLRAFDEANTPEETAEAAYGYYHELALVSGNTFAPLIYRSFRAPILNLWARFARKHGKESLSGNAARLNAFIVSRDAQSAIKCVESSVGEAIEGSREIYED
ncbi:MAG TPA: GntR family transcriptional regulator [Clostridia bacterium]|nr:GntR family transcriptional regulator [Clostridia bacterium]